MSLELPSQVIPDETLARFLRQSSYVAKTTGRIKHNAFLPAPDDDTSVFRVTDLTQEDVKAIAVKEIQERSKYGAAEFKAKLVENAKLQILGEEPPPRHANIRGWSLNDDPELKTSERKTAAMILSEDSKWMNW